jgi:parallel beta-helix repeat protein
VNISDKHNQTILEDRRIRENVKISECTKCKIKGCDFSSNDEGDMLHFSRECRDIDVIDCKFHGKRKRGCAVRVDGGDDDESIPRRIHFKNCTWEDLEDDCEEPLRIGDSRRSHLSYESTVEDCKFIGLKADEETISIKSCGNVVKNCRHENCKGSFIIRHGHTNTFEGNTFTGEHGGIRIWGKNNKILRNTFIRNSSNKHYPLRVLNGDSRDERNDGSSTSDDDGHSDHTQVRNLEISGNKFDNCRKCVLWGDSEDEHNDKPTGVRFINNRIIADDVDCQVIDFDDASPERNEFADNVVVGTRADIDNRIERGFRRE